MLKILTLTLNGEQRLSKLKQSLNIALSGIDYHWYIKDNKSKDNTVEVASKWDNTTVIAYKNNNQNFSQGCNYLFNYANPNDDDLIMLLNDDVIFNDNQSVQSMIDLMADNVGVVGAKLLYTNTNKLQHAGVVFDTRYNAPTHFRLNDTDDVNSSKNREFQVVTGAVLLTKAKYYRDVNLMDENYHWAFDDVDLCLSIKYKLDKKIVYCGNTNIFHEESATLKKTNVNKLYEKHNLNYLRNKWNGKVILDSGLYKDPNYNLYDLTK